jgi:hypothetical protein
VLGPDLPGRSIHVDVDVLASVIFGFNDSLGNLRFSLDFLYIPEYSSMFVR